MIQKFTHDDLVGRVLKHWGEGKLVAGQPASVISGKRIRAFEGKIENCGIWEASPGHFVREVEAA